jgi:dTDP-4-amino-4,6-dideoxygalactose transaminase
VSAAEDFVPLVDLAWQHREIADEVRAGFDEVIAGNAFILGPAVARFERCMADAVGAAHCIGVGSGTDALELALRALDVGPGDEVVVPAHTFVATALAVLRAGATPIVVDVDAGSLQMDPARAEAALSPRTRVLMPVHMFGQMVPLEPFEALAREHGLALVEDAAQAHGARSGGRCAGSVGVAAGLSFYPGKNLGAYGDAGAVLTSDDEVAERLRRLRNWGSDTRYHHPERGFNSRLDTLQAVVLQAKLARLERWNERRRQAALRYDEALAPLVAAGRLRIPARPGGPKAHVFHLYPVLVADGRRDAVLEGLQARGIGAGVHYPTPLHLHGALASLGHAAGDFPVAERACRELLSLPMHPGLEPAQQERVARALTALLGA